MKQYIDGALVNGAGDLMHVYNPATGQEEASFSGASPAQALEALQAAQRAFAEWSALSIAQRERHILRLADAIESYQSEVVDILIAETGKPMATALYDFGMLVDCLRYFNEEMKRMHGQIISDYDNSHTNLICANPSVWWPPIWHGTSRCSTWATSWGPFWPRAAPVCSSLPPLPL